jgi:alpha-2-macroglobulin
VRVTGADGQPAADSEVALVAVDEAILALTGYALADPISSFYPSPPAGVSDYYFRSDLLVATLEESLEAGLDSDQKTVTIQANSAQVMGMGGLGSKGSYGMGMVGTGAGGGGGRGTRMDRNRSAAPIALREDFRALALFAPSVITGDDGRASIELELPDNLTRYRLMAVAVHGEDRFGWGESALTARLPLMVRPSPPRFLNWGDRMEMPVVVQNQTDQPRQVRLAVRGANIGFGQTHARSVEVPARDRVEVRFRGATEEAGEATVQVAAASDGWADAAQDTFPVWTPATTEAFATYGTLDDADLAQPIGAPSDAVAQFGGLEVSTSSTAVQELTDAVLYLVEYPYECSEQLASRVMGIAALKDVLEAFDAEGLPERDELIEAVERDIDKLEQLQRPDGGFYLWSRRDTFRFPYASVHVAHALIRARHKGFEVPDTMLDKAQGFLEQVERHIPRDYSQISRNAVKAYAYYVLGLMGEPALAKARRLATGEPGDELSMEAIGWLLTALSGDEQAAARRDELLRYVDNRATETAASAQFTTSYGGQEHILMHSSRRTDAVLLEALMAVRPDGELIAKLVRGLLSHRTRGRWLNTQENAFVLLALDRYFAAYESKTPDFVARMWLGEGYVGEHRFEGRTTDRKRVDIPMQTLVGAAGDKPADLVLQKEGDGRLYYRIGMRYAPESLELEPAEYGFSVERRYEGVDDPADVSRDDDGTWRIEAGSRVRVVLSMVAPARRYHVALVDPLPAGLEPLNPALAVTEEIPDPRTQSQRSGYWWWYRPWYAHQNLRDERAEAFAPMVHAGVHDYSYVTRATTPGEFVAPPTKAEEMYYPETFGRSGTDRVIIE